MIPKCFVCGKPGTVPLIFPHRFICVEHYKERKDSLTVEKSFIVPLADEALKQMQKTDVFGVLAKGGESVEDEFQTALKNLENNGRN